MRHRIARAAGPAGLALLALATLPFVFHAFGRGIAGLAGDASACESLCWPEVAAATPAIFIHMVLGAAITVLVLVQLIRPIRHRWPAVHRWIGRVTVILALGTAAGGLVYMAGVGTAGGPVMTTGFTLYGLLMAAAAAMTFRFAHARNFARHRRWALRLLVLALGSWLFRVHYAVWYLTTGGAGTAPDFSGPFDRIQVFAFYLPYLLVLELYLRRKPAAAFA